MSKCLNTDSLLEIGSALDWRIAEGLEHLRTCEECQAHLETLRLTHQQLFEVEAVEAEVLQTITAALHTAARRETRRERRSGWLGQSAEAVTAGITSLFVVVSSGIRLDNPAAAAAAFALGATLITLAPRVIRGTPFLEA